jgi:potassium-transporting ATPase KdpC subunit
MKVHLRIAAILFILLTIICGLIYPLVVTGIGKVIYPHQVNGSLITDNQKIIGSELIGQNFTDSGHFWGRPSATGTFPYNPMASSGSNLGPLNPALQQAIKDRVAELRKYNPADKSPVPIDLVTASASGLDPEISPSAAYFQIDRIAKTRHLSPDFLKQLVNNHMKSKQFGILGEARVNVLKLNLALDKLATNS